MDCIFFLAQQHFGLQPSSDFLWQPNCVLIRNFQWNMSFYKILIMIKTISISYSVRPPLHVAKPHVKAHGSGMTPVHRGSARVGHCVIT